MRNAASRLVRAGGALLLLSAPTACDPGQPWLGPRVVEVATVERRTVPELVEYPATLVAPARVDVVARTEGYLLERAFEDGTEVEQDRVLFGLQSDAYDTAVARHGPISRNVGPGSRARTSPPGVSPWKQAERGSREPFSSRAIRHFGRRSPAASTRIRSMSATSSDRATDSRRSCSSTRSTPRCGSRRKTSPACAPHRARLRS